MDAAKATFVIPHQPAIFFGYRRDWSDIAASAHANCKGGGRKVEVKMLDCEMR